MELWEQEYVKFYGLPKFPTVPLFEPKLVTDGLAHESPIMRELAIQRASWRLRADTYEFISRTWDFYAELITKGGTWRIPRGGTERILASAAATNAAVFARMSQDTAPTLKKIEQQMSRLQAQEQITSHPVNASAFTASGRGVLTSADDTSLALALQAGAALEELRATNQQLTVR